MPANRPAMLAYARAGGWAPPVPHTRKVKAETKKKPRRARARRGA